MECPNCGFNEHLEDAVYCQECGIFLINLCSNDMCELNNDDPVSLPENSKFCHVCGEKSSFNINGFFDNE